MTRRFQLQHGTYEIPEGTPHPVGQGAYGVVWRVRRVEDGQFFALKEVQRNQDRNGVPGAGDPYTISEVRKITEKLKEEIEFLR